MAVSPFKLQELSRLLDHGRFAQAEGELLKLGRIMPGDSNVAGLMVSLFMQTGRLEQAAFAAERRAALLPNDADAQSGLIQVLLAAKKPEDAIGRARKLYERTKNSPQAALLLASTLLNSGRAAEAAALVADRIQAGMHGTDLLGIRAAALLAMGRAVDSAEILRAILSREPEHPLALSLLASVLNYVPRVDPVEHFSVHQSYGRSMQKFTPGGAGVRKLRARVKDAPINIGLISADLHEHSVARFVEPLLKHGGGSRARFILIAMGTTSDKTSLRLAGLADAWRDLRPLSAARLAEIAEEEKLDLLIELGGHMTNTPLPLMIPRIAPLQGSAIGYPNTTGLPTIDLRIVDSITDPPGASDERATERLVRVDPCFLCFQPPEDAPEVSALPATRNGFVTFGSFNALSKVTDEQLRDWAELLRRVPHSKLLLKAIALDDAGTKQDLLERAARAGVSSESFVLVGRKGSTREHLMCYGEVDIALDTFPYHGTTTTCEALWMGVPVVTHAGASHASRVGASLLGAAGLSEFVARDRDEGFAIATRLASDLPALESLRLRLRELVRKSVLCDGVLYARRWKDAILKVVEEHHPA